MSNPQRRKWILVKMVKIKAYKVHEWGYQYYYIGTSNIKDI